MPGSESFPEITSSLEDYLETIYELQRDGREVRVRDIAEARGVKAGSVSPALRRLADQGLIDYTRRAHIGLTPLGERAAQRIHARHRLLERRGRPIPWPAPWSTASPPPSPRGSGGC